MEVVLFVPGFFGFGSFGHPDRPLIEYFARVEDALLRAHVRPIRFAVHQPPPAGSLANRVRSLHLKAAQVLREGASRLHLVGHSTGGLDARLLAHPRYTGLPERGDLIARIASVITLSAPFHGTPLAGRIEGSAWFAAPALWFGSILASRGRLRLAGQVATLFNLVKRAGRQEPTPTDELIRALQGGDVVSPISFVSVAPKPGFSPWTFAFAPLQRLLYDLTYRLTAGRPPEGARAPEGSWIGGHQAALTPTANDGIVPAWSQTLDGHAEGMVLGDHLDVIGHYEAAGATFLKSGSKFDDHRFRALWERVGRALGSPRADA